MLKDVLKEFRNDGKPGHKIAADLVAIADKHGMSPQGVSRFPELLKEKKLKPADITPTILTTAKLIERFDWHQTEQQINRINESRKPKPKASPIVKIIYRVLMTVKVSLNEKGAFKARKELAEAGIDIDDVTDALMEKVQTYQNQLLGG